MLPKPTITKLTGRKLPHRVTYRDGGKRKTRHFRTLNEAAVFAREQGLEDSIPEMRISVDERMALVRLRAAATSADVSLDQVVDAAIEMASQRKSKSVDMFDAIKAYLEDCERRNLRPATMAHYRGMLSRLLRPYHGAVRNLRRDQVRDWITGMYDTEESRRTARTPVMAFLRWCGRQGWADANLWRDPLKWQVRLSDEREIGILRPAHLWLLFKRIPVNLHFTIALLAFTGLRPKGELTRVSWSMIDRRRRLIDLPGSATKIRRGRVLQGLPDVFWEWVEWERQRQGELVGRVLPITYRNFRAHLSKTGVPWPHDATRHSFASYGYHSLGLERTVEIMGHIGGFRMFASRYKAAASPEAARLWFSVRPRRL